MKKMVQLVSSSAQVLIQEQLERFKKEHALGTALHEVVDSYKSFSWSTLLAHQSTNSLFDSDNNKFVLLDLPQNPDSFIPATAQTIFDDWITSSRSTKPLFIRAPLFSYLVCNRAWYKSLLKQGVIKVLRPHTITLTTWLAARSAHKGLELDGTTIKKIIRTHGSDLDAIENQLSIMALSPEATLDSPSGYRILTDFKEELPRLQAARLIAFLHSFEKQNISPFEVFAAISFYITGLFNQSVGRWGGTASAPFSKKIIARFYCELNLLENVIKGIRRVPPWFALRAYVKRLCSVAH